MLRARRQSQSKRTQPLAKLASSMNPHAVYMRGDSDLLILVLAGRARPGIWGSGQGFAYGSRPSAVIVSGACCPVQQTGSPRSAVAVAMTGQRRYRSQDHYSVWQRRTHCGQAPRAVESASLTTAMIRSEERRVGKES